jgi:hypothetical protein
MFSPDAVNTTMAMQNNAHSLSAVLADRAAATAFALSYDCSVFGANDLCLSGGLRGNRVNNFNNDSAEIAGLLTAAYRLTPESRIGGFIDHGLVRHSPEGVTPLNTSPMLGGFAVFQEKPDFAGLTLRAGLAYQKGDLSITRAEFENTEAGTGQAKTTALSVGAEIAYGVPVENGWLAQSYLGILRSDSQRNGYTEAFSGSVQFPISYDQFGREVNSATAGLRLRWEPAPQIGVVLGAGVEYDLDAKQDAYSGTSDIVGLEQFAISIAEESDKLRAIGSVGVRYVIAPNEVLGLDASLRQLPYGNDVAVATMVRYSIGF